MIHGISTACPARLNHARAKELNTFHQKALCGNIWGAIRYLMKQGKGGILYPDGINEKTKKTVQSVPDSKHPDSRIPGANVLTNYPFLPNVVNLNITEDSIKVTACCLSGGTGLGGMYTHATTAAAAL
jgi:hypothetical protein